MMRRTGLELSKYEPVAQAIAKLLHPMGEVVINVRRRLRQRFRQASLTSVIVSPPPAYTWLRASMGSRRAALIAG